MVIYSHSRLATFEQCPLKFKYKYIDKIIPEIEKSIEAFLGSMVHETLEWLYHEVKKGRVPTIEGIVSFYAEKWQENYESNIAIVKKSLTAEDYFNKGVSYLVNYYMKHKPFEENTIEIEKKILIDLDNEGEYKLQGFIDRLVHNLEKDMYEVHDYKTANNLPSQEKIDKDRQLALYSLGVKNIFGKDKKVLLVWHYLAHNMKICSHRTNEQLEELKKATLALIKKIEETKDFPLRKSILCDWCEYKFMCPGFCMIKQKNQKELNKD